MELRESLSLSLFPLLLSQVFSVSLLHPTILRSKIPPRAISLRSRLTVVGLNCFWFLIDCTLFLTSVVLLVVLCSCWQAWSLSEDMQMLLEKLQIMGTHLMHQVFYSPNWRLCYCLIVALLTNLGESLHCSKLSQTSTEGACNLYRMGCFGTGFSIQNAGELKFSSSAQVALTREM